MINDAPDPELSEEELEKISFLNEEQIHEIDTSLINHCSKQWQKVAKIVGTTMVDLPNRVRGIPDIYYANRVKRLVEIGLLEAQGNLNYMRFSEVKLKENK